MIATIGYEKASLENFIAALLLSDIDVLVDVRDRAQSRRKGFSKTALREALNLEGIEYVHFRELGDPKEGREAARRQDYNLFRKIYETVIKTPKAQEALSSIGLMLKRKSVCLMCYEMDPHICHRSMISDEIERRHGIKTTHLKVVHDLDTQIAKRRMLHTGESTAA